MSVRYASGVLTQFANNLALVTNAASHDGLLTPSAYRWTLDKEPDSAMDGKYFLAVQRGTPHERKWGTGENIQAAIVTVQLSYFRGGGDLGGGDRQSVMRDAADDCQRVSDVCENPENYNSDTSGIREIRYQGFQKVFDGKHAEIWEVTFWVQWRSDLAVLPVYEATATGGGIAVMTITGEWTSTSTTGADEEVVGAPLTIDFDDFTFSTVKLRLLGFAKVSSGAATYRLRMGGTLNGIDGTEVASMSTGDTTYDLTTGVGTAFTRPSGQAQFQVTITGDTVAATSYLQGISIAVLDGAS